MVIFNFVKSLLIERAGKIQLKRTLAENIIILLSTVMEMSFKWPGMKNIFIDVMDSISDVMLVRLITLKLIYNGLSLLKLTKTRWLLKM